MNYRASAEKNNLFYLTIKNDRRCPVSFKRYRKLIFLADAKLNPPAKLILDAINILQKRFFFFQWTENYQTMKSPQSSLRNCSSFLKKVILKILVKYSTFKYIPLNFTEQLFFITIRIFWFHSYWKKIFERARIFLLTHQNKWKALQINKGQFWNGWFATFLQDSWQEILFKKGFRSKLNLLFMSGKKNNLGLRRTWVVDNVLYQII